MSAFWSSVTSPLAHVGAVEFCGHRKTETSTLSYQSSFILPICICSRAAAPTKVSDTKVTRMTEIVIDRLRRRPMPISERMNCSRTSPAPSAVRAVHAAGLVADHLPRRELDHALAHLVHD